MSSSNLNVRLTLPKHKVQHCCDLLQALNLPTHEAVSVMLSLGIKALPDAALEDFVSAVDSTSASTGGQS